MRSASTSLPGQPGSVPTARRWASSTLSSWGLPETGWSAAQIVSELATNVTLHARSSFTLTLAVDEDCVRLEVEDASPVTLQARTYGATATTGRGLHIVGTLAQDWGVVVHARGKTVWALLPVEDAGGDGDERRRSTGARDGSGARAGKAAPSGTVAMRWAA